MREGVNWPPSYTLKKSARAQRVYLKAIPRRGLEIIVPARYKQVNLTEVLDRNRAWIEKQLHSIQAELNQTKLQDLPAQISLSALEQCWGVTYVESSHKKVAILHRPHQEIVVIGNIQDKSLCQKALLSWVKQQASTHLLAWLDILSKKLCLPYNKVSIRAQQGRWGSCSSTGSISLNYKLIFLPYSLVEHIIIHELCHTVHMNHSEKFWQLVASFDPGWQQHKADMRHATKMIPLWCELS